MNKTSICTILLTLSIFPYAFSRATSPEADAEIPAQSPTHATASFTSPEGWRFADSISLPPSVRMMVVGSSSHHFPPSLNLGTEHYKGTLKEYLKVVKAINDARGIEWKDLGKIMTEAGEASLSQLDQKTEWGDVRMMHAILLRDEMVYILTAAALKEEFARFYSDFFQAMKSLRIEQALRTDPVKNQRQRNF